MPDCENEIFPVNLTEEQVMNGPETDIEKPVSRQQELKLYGHYPLKTLISGKPLATSTSSALIVLLLFRIEKAGY